MIVLLGLARPIAVNNRKQATQTSAFMPCIFPDHCESRASVHCISPNQIKIDVSYSEVPPAVLPVGRRTLGSLDLRLPESLLLLSQRRENHCSHC